MAELTLCRSIILDSGEIVPAGTILKDYGDLTSRSIAPSQAPLIEELCSNPQKDILTKFESKHIIDFFRIPRECVSQASTSGSLKKIWVKGDERVAPFPCFVKATKMCEERCIELIDTYGQIKRRFFDKNLDEIEVFAISSLGNMTIGSQWKLGNLKSVKILSERISDFSTVIGYYYADTDCIKVEHLLRRKFYVELRSYRYERTFDELSVGRVFLCYSISNSNVICKGRICVLERGDNEWYESFRKAHTWLDEDKYHMTEDDTHIFVRSMHYDGRLNISKLSIIHKSSDTFLFSDVKRQKVLIKDTSKYY